MPAAPASSAGLESDACYLAMKAHDARFDGCFFTGVTSTGIYCRPVCRVRTPRRENCRFFRHAAQAEAAGFRPCLRCRPELAPHAAGVVDRGRLAHPGAAGRAAARRARRLERRRAGRRALAARLGVSDRHLRRIFEPQFGVSPLQYLQTRRLLAAKQLLADTRLPMTQVALSSGFASVRRFNAAFVAALRPEPDAPCAAPAPPAARAKAIRSGAARLPAALRREAHARLLRARRGVARRRADDRGRRAPLFARTLRVAAGRPQPRGLAAAALRPEARRRCCCRSASRSPRCCRR